MRRVHELVLRAAAGARADARAYDVDYRDVSLVAADGAPLHAWLVLPKGEPVGRMLFLHGNAQNVSHHLPSALWWAAAGHEVLALDYRGYGRSGGVPSLDGALLDVAAAGRWLAARDAAAVDAGGEDLPLGAFGQSLGASLAVLWLAGDAAARDVVDALVIESGFAGFGHVAGDIAGGLWFTWPFQWIPRLTLAGVTDPVDVVDRIGVPLMVVHSADDTIVGIDHGRTLFDAARPPKRFVEARGPHIAAAAEPAVRDAALGFVAGAAREEVPREP